jgi:hypothetical protein
VDPIKLLKLRGALAKAPELWQYRLLDADALCRYTNEHGGSIFSGETVVSLWRAGILRADMLTVKPRNEVPGFVMVSKNRDKRSFSDARHIEPRPRGFGGAFADPPPDLFTEVELFFHPFRFYVLYHVARVFRSNASTTQYLASTAGALRIAQHDIDALDSWTSSEKFGERFDYWNTVTELAIVSDPIGYPAVFNERRVPTTSEEKFEARRNRYGRQLFAFLAGLGAGEIDRSRDNLCQNAESLDGNKTTHVLLRLMSSHERHKLRGTIGGCMLLLTMAEVIRRAAEEALKKDLREEDELGFGQWMKGARKAIYGAERILDAAVEVRRDFLTSVGLDAGVKVRCYVEGDTEIGALRSALGGAPQVEFVNLRGQFVERGGRGLQFVGSLANDKRSHIFSVVVLDGDDEDNLRAVKKAAKDGIFFGRFFVQMPDVEFANFTLDELIAVAAELAQAKSVVPPSIDEIKSAVVSTVKAFLHQLDTVGLSVVRKGDDWGTGLMRHAVKSETLPQGHKRVGTVGPLIEVARLLVQGRQSGYLRSVEKFMVDSETGELRPK